MLYLLALRMTFIERKHSLVSHICVYSSSELVFIFRWSFVRDLIEHVHFLTTRCASVIIYVLVWFW